MRGMPLLMLLALASASPEPPPPPPTPGRRVSDDDLRRAEATLSTEGVLPGSFSREEVEGALVVVAFGRCERALDAGPLYGADDLGVVHEARTPEQAVDALGKCGGVLLRAPPWREVIYDGPVTLPLRLAIDAWDATESPDASLGDAICAAAGVPARDWGATLGMQVGTRELEDGSFYAEVAVVTGEVAVAI